MDSWFFFFLFCCSTHQIYRKYDPIRYVFPRSWTPVETLTIYALINTDQITHIVPFILRKWFNNFYLTVFSLSLLKTKRKFKLLWRSGCCVLFYVVLYCNTITDANNRKMLYHRIWTQKLFSFCFQKGRKSCQKLLSVCSFNFGVGNNFKFSDI